MNQNNTNTKKNNIKKNDNDLSLSESESISSSNNDFQIGNLSGLNGILKEDSSYLNNHSTSFSLNSNSQKNVKYSDKRFKCPEEDIKDNFSNLSDIPDIQNEESSENGLIQDLFENIYDNNKNDENESIQEKEFKILGKKRRAKSLHFESDSFEEKPSENKDKV